MDLKLRSKVILLVAGAAFIPLLAVTTITVFRLQTIQRDNAIAREAEITRSISAEIKAFIVSQFDILKNNAGIFAEHGTTGEEQNAALERALLSNSAFTELSSVDTYGIEWRRVSATLAIPPETLGRDRSQSPEFIATRDNGSSIGPIFLADGSSLFIIGTALTGPDQHFSGAVFATINARVMHEVITRISTGMAHERAYIVNERGIVVVHPDLSIVRGERDFSALPAVRRAISGMDDTEESATPYTNQDGEQVLGTGAQIVLTLGKKVLPTNWFIIVETPVTVAFAPVREITLFALATLAAVLALASAIALIFAGRIVRPMEQLSAASERFGAGDFAYRVAVTTHDEIEDLGHAFNRMAEEVARSITDLKRERGVIAAERNKIELVLSGITDAVIAVDRERNIILFNRAAETITGTRSARALGRRIDRVIRFFEGTRELAPGEYAPMKVTDTDSVSYTKQGIRLVDGYHREHFVDLVAGQIKGGAEIGLGCIITLHDVSREKLLERIKSEFVSIAAHQLRTPLTAIKWALREFRDRHPQSTLESGDLLDKAYQSNERMINLINDLLNVARIEEGRFLYRLAVTNLGASIERAIAAEHMTALKKNITIGFKKPSAEILVWADAHGIDLVLQNLIENAIHYTKSGGKITLHVRAVETMAEISIQDTGIGVPEGERSRLFTKFFRGDQAVRMETDGSGLGLFIVKNIIEAHGGSIWFDSKEGKGTTFFFTIPTASPEQLARA
ncbi:MAG: ATP-binding protein, partial [Candidatus Sungbacteria bacterium]|nr:ATP-binding protein [Candidatus Sungbacteria bacterium]